MVSGSSREWSQPDATAQVDLVPLDFLTPADHGEASSRDSATELVKARVSVDGSPAPAAEPRSPRLERVRTVSIRPSPTMLRSRVDSADLMALAASIKRNGIAQPLFVRVLSEEPRLYELFSGYRRWRAALVAEIDYLPVIVFGHLSEPTTLELSVLENSNRRDMSIIEEARAFHVLVEKFGRTATQIASLTGRSVNQVVNMLTLVALPEEVKHSLRSGQIGFAHARAVARAADPICLARRVIAEKLTVRETELLADQLRPRAGRTDLAPTASDDQTQIEGVGRIDTESPIRFAESGTRRDLTTLQAALRATAGAGIEVGTDCDDTRLVIDGRSREDVTRIVSILRDALWLLRMNTLVRSEGVRTARDLCKE